MKLFDPSNSLRVRLKQPWVYISKDLGAGEGGEVVES